ncbi:MAG: type II toxin-antitoxin system PemK/MazF family toxin [Bryobacteraceae bacterium]
MAITFIPDAGDVLMCDFTGFVAPEITKVRRVIILSPRSRRRFPGTYLVIPMSKTPPAPPEPHHCEFKPNSYFFLDPVEPVWAKADMLTCVASYRLDRLKVNGRYCRVQIRKDDLHAVRRAVLHALGMDTWARADIIERHRSV